MVDRGDNTGQWLLLMAVVVGAGMAILLVFINQSMMAGFASSGAILDFPKNDIREIRSETIGEATEIGKTENMDGTITLDEKKINFNAAFNQYCSDLTRFYAPGAIVSVSCVDMKTNTLVIEKVTLKIYYNDGNTAYTENIDVYLV
jgi:hypothetical protein